MCLFTFRNSTHFDFDLILLILQQKKKKKKLTRVREKWINRCNQFKQQHQKKRKNIATKTKIQTTHLVKCLHLMSDFVAVDIERDSLTIDFHSSHELLYLKQICISFHLLLLLFKEMFTFTSKLSLQSEWNESTKKK